MGSAAMVDHLKQLSTDAESVILATCALARRTGGPLPAGPGSSAGSVDSGVDARELAKDLAAAQEEIRAHAAQVAEWGRKVASAEEAQKVAAEAFNKGQRDVQMFKEQCEKKEKEAQVCLSVVAESVHTRARIADGLWNR